MLKFTLPSRTRVAAKRYNRRMADAVNKSGRKPGRGIRPWLLIPKVLCVAIVFGGLVAALAISMRVHQATPRQWLVVISDLNWIFTRAIVPGLLGSIGFGIALLMQHPRELIRMRWLRLKLLLLVVGLPTLHLWMSHLLSGMRESATEAEKLTNMLGEPVRLEHWTQFRIGLVIGVATVALIICIGRQKPRLGQRYGTPSRDVSKGDET